MRSLIIHAFVMESSVMKQDWGEIASNIYWEEIIEHLGKSSFGSGFSLFFLFFSFLGAFSPPVEQQCKNVFTRKHIWSISLWTDDSQD